MRTIKIKHTDICFLIEMLKRNHPSKKGCIARLEYYKENRVPELEGASKNSIKLQKILGIINE